MRLRQDRSLAAEGELAAVTAEAARLLANEAVDQLNALSDAAHAIGVVSDAPGSGQPDDVITAQASGSIHGARLQATELDARLGARDEERGQYRCDPCDQEIVDEGRQASGNP